MDKAALSATAGGLSATMVKNPAALITTVHNHLTNLRYCRTATQDFGLAKPPPQAHTQTIIG